ncbi:MAG: transketolase [Thermoanaerobaculia bacterium]
MTERAAVDRHQIAINTIRFLAVDMVEKANSGHPGAPMGLAPLAYTLWTRHLRQNPADPTWPNRDRFVLSCGHASTLLYSLLHLSGHELPLEELQNFRQWGSKTPGHPERDPATGVEMTTGPLGQGLSTAVGMAIAERMLATTFNREGFPVIDHRVWVVASDGDMMEGIASEASSLAAHLGLGRLTVLYDDNKISIDGPTSLSFSEDVGKRYEAYGWHVQRVEDGNDLEALDAAMTAAVVEDERPSFIVVRTHIAYGSPNKQDTASSHGAPLGADEVRATKEALDWPLEPTFHVPDEAREAFRETREQGARLEDEWNELFGRYQKAEPELAAQFRQWLDGELPAGWEEKLPTFAPADGPLATRKASGKVLNAVCAEVRQLVGGSADLTGSVNTYLDGYDEFAAAEPGGRNLHFGVREHAMGAILNGMALSGMLRPYGGTFLIFSDYMRPAIRLAAMMELPVIYVFTHDSIFLGEDGPTHQPVSQLLSLRSIPGLTVIRPADANETAAAWQCAIDRQNGPTALALTRHKLPVLDATGEMARQGVARGAYVIADPPEGEPQVILIASGSEVSLALEAQARLIDDGIAARVVSMPSWELFDAQDRSYRESVLPPFIDKRLAIEAGTPLGWERYVGNDGATLGVEGFGASAPYKALADHYGFTVNEVVQRVLKIL